MKLGSASIDDALNELDFVLREIGTPEAMRLLSEANRRYRDLHTTYLEWLRAANRGAIAEIPLTDVQPKAAHS